MTKLSLIAALALTAAGTAMAADEKETPSIADRVDGMTPLEGFVDLYWDEATGRLFLELGRPGREMLYQVSLASGQ